MGGDWRACVRLGSCEIAFGVVVLGRGSGWWFMACVGGVRGVVRFCSPQVLHSSLPVASFVLGSAPVKALGDYNAFVWDESPQCELWRSQRETKADILQSCADLKVGRGCEARRGEGRGRQARGGTGRRDDARAADRRGKGCFRKLESRLMEVESGRQGERVVCGDT